jgi:hypothetical protein
MSESTDAKKMLDTKNSIEEENHVAFKLDDDIVNI